MFTDTTEDTSKVKKTKKAKRQGGTSTKTIESVTHAKLSPENDKWVRDQAIETGQPKTVIINKALAAIRTGKKLTIEKYEPKYLTRALAGRENRIARLKKTASA